MRQVLRLFTVLAQAALLATSGWFVFALVAFLVYGSSFPRSSPSVGQAIALVAVVFLPVGAAVYWIHRVLRNSFSPREAWAVAISFAIVTPVSLLGAIPLAQIPGGYAAYLGRPLGLVGALASIVVVMTIVAFVPSVLVLWIMRRLSRV